MRPSLSRLSAPLLAVALLAGCTHTAKTPERPAEAQAPTNVIRETPPSELEVLQVQAQRGDPESQFKLGSHFFVAKDYRQAQYWWARAADQGNAVAAVSLAFLYTGRNDPALANQPEMLRYLNQSAAAGNPMAQHVLGSLYLRGEGVPRDPDQARRLYQSACAQHYEASCKAVQALPDH